MKKGELALQTVVIAIIALVVIGLVIYVAADNILGAGETFRQTSEDADEDFLTGDYEIEQESTDDT